MSVLYNFVQIGHVYCIEGNFWGTKYLWFSWLEL